MADYMVNKPRTCAVKFHPSTSHHTFGGRSMLSIAAATVVLIMTPLLAAAETKEEIENQLRNLWKDRPDYVAAVHNHTRPMRVVHAVAPTVGPREHIANEHVDVAFVLSPDGQIEDVRILHSTDHTLDQACMDAVRQSTFVHADGDSGPERAIGVMPFNFSS